MGNNPRLIIGFLLFVLLFSPPSNISLAAELTEVTDIIVVKSEEGDRISIDLARSVEPHVFWLREPLRLVVDLPDCKWTGEKKVINVGSSRIKEVRMAQFDTKPYIVRVVAELEEVVPYKLIKTENRLMVHIGGGQGEEGEEEREAVLITQKETYPPLSHKEFKIVVLGKTLPARKQIFIEGTLMVKATELFRIFRKQVKFDSKTKEIRTSWKGKKLSFAANSDKMKIEGKVKLLKAPSVIIKGTFYIPLDSVVEYLGYGTFWDDKNKVMKVDSPAIMRIEAVAIPYGVKVAIFSNYPMSFKLRKLEEPSRIIVDIPKVSFRANKLTKIHQGKVLCARAYQLGKNPKEISRIVVDLKKGLKHKIFQTPDKKKISLVLVHPRQKVKKFYPKEYPYLKGKTIVIEPGHGGKDPGAIASGGITEKEINLETATKLCRLLSNAGAFVILSREEDISMNGEEIVKLANENKADIFLSLHYNASQLRRTAGIETYYFRKSGRLLAKAIHRKLVEMLKRKDRGVKKEKFYTIHHTKMPAALIEPAYISNRKERQLIQTDIFKESIAKAIFAGINRYFKLVKR